jgi:hypothetical protein
MSQATTFQGMKFEVNWGNYDVFATPDGMVAVVVDRFRGKQVKRFKGESAWADADRYATDLHWTHDIGNR